MGKIVILLRIRWEMVSHLGEILSCKRSKASDSPLGLQAWLQNPSFGLENPSFLVYASVTGETLLQKVTHSTLLASTKDCFFTLRSLFRYFHSNHYT